MDESLSTEYDKYFSNFYREFYKYQSGSKKHLTCDGCSTKKRFIMNENQLIFSCGPRHNKDKKCGQQYTIDLPKYINFDEFYKFYNEQINGSFHYTKNNLLEYDLKNLHINVSDFVSKQDKNSEENKKLLEKLINDYCKENHLNEIQETIKTLYEKRYKNSIDKKKIMKKLMNEELSEEEKVIERKKYAVLIQENKEFIEIIQSLKKSNKKFIMIQQPQITVHNKED